MNRSNLDTLCIKNASQDADSFGTNICVCYNSLNSLTLPLPNPHQFPHVIYKTKRKFMNFIANVRHYITDNIIFYKDEEPFSRVLLNCTVTVQCVRLHNMKSIDRRR